MAHDTRTDGRDGRTDGLNRGIWRRQVLAVGGGLGATVLAGCLSETPDDDAVDGDDPDEDGGSGSNFRLLVSDQPADIGDFDRLDVSFDRVRVFDGGQSEDEDGTEDDQTEDDQTEDDQTEEGDGDAPGNESSDEGNETDAESTDETDDQSDAESGDDEDAPDGVTRREGYYVLDLDGATVDLTQVIGEKAMPVFEGELSEGTYEKLELHVAEIDGVVDGEQVEVTVPSGKLQLTRSFEVRAEDPVDFVYDINVVKRGRQNSYNLQPVISESGVAGKDVDVEEIENGRGGDDAGPDGGDGSGEGNESGDSGGSNDGSGGDSSGSDDEDTDDEDTDDEGDE